MMSGLLGSLLGFGGSVVQHHRPFHGKKADNKFELQKMEKMAELRAKGGFDHEMKMFETQAAMTTNING